MMAAALLRVLVICAYGVPLARALNRNLRGGALFGTGLLLGAGSLALELYFLSVAGVPWSRTAVIGGALPLLVVASIIALLRRPAEPASGVRYDQRAAIVDGLAALPVIGHAFYATWSGLYEWDFFGIWGLKARTFFDYRGIDWVFTGTSIAHPDYPLLVPLLFDLEALLSGRWEERTLGLMFTALAAALIVIARQMLSDEWQSHHLAALAMPAVVFPALNMWVGLAEPAVMAYGCAGLLFIRKGDPSSVRTGAVLLGFAAWSKNEGLALIVVALITLLILRRYRDALRLWPAALVISPWLITRAVLSLPTDFVDRWIVHRMLHRLADPGATLRAFVSSPPDQPVFWLAVLLTILVCARRAFSQERFLTIALALQTLLFIAQGLATRVDFRAHVNLTMNRLPSQVAPAFAVLAVLLLMPSLRQKEEHELPTRHTSAPGS